MNRAAIILLASLSSAVVALIVQLALTHNVAQSDVGTIVLALSAANLLQAVCNFGAPWLILQNHAAVVGPRGHLINMTAAPTLLAVCLTTFVISQAIPPTNGNWAIYLAVALTALIMQAMTESASAQAQSLQLYGASIAFTLYPQLSRMLVIALFAYSKESPILSICFGYIYSALVGIFASYYFVSYRSGVDHDTNFRSFSASNRHFEFYTASYPYVVMTIFTAGLTQILTVLQGAFLSAQNVAIFSVAALAFAAACLPAGIINGRLLVPYFAQLQSGTKRLDPRISFGSVLFFNISFAALMSISTFICASAIPYAFGQEYAPSSILVKMLSIAVFSRYLSLPFASIMTLRGNIQSKLLIHVSVGIFVVFLYLILASNLKLYGAVISLTAGEIALTSAQIFRSVNLLRKLFTLVGPAGSALDVEAAQQQAADSDE